jgi:hypothetical protein
MYLILAGFLLVASGLSFNAAFVNWFFADFHDECCHANATRGNILFLSALIFLAGFTWLVVAISRSITKSTKTA